MKAIVYDEPGPPGVLHVADVPTPDAGPDDVVIAVEAAGVSRADTLQRRGQYPPPPGASEILGLEVAGTIASAGANVAAWTVGDRVCALLPGGGYARYARADAGSVLPIPDGWSFVEAATLPENAFTVYDNLFTRARLTRSETLLVHGGSSGIGTTAIMFAVAFGARVFTTAGSAEKCAATVHLGAAAAIDYKTQDFVAEVSRLTGGKGVNAILDLVGGDYIPRDLAALALDGRIVCLATARGREATIDLGMMLQRRATLMGSSLRARSAAQKAAIARELRERIWPLLPAKDPIRPVVDSVFAFADSAGAHARLESSMHVGKIVLTP